MNKAKILVYLMAIFIACMILTISWLFNKNKMGSLVMPGPLVSSHAEYEQDCNQCHSQFDKQSQNNLCLNCHEAVKADIQNGMGFHGKEPLIVEKQCKSCHTDHIGRKADIIQLDKETFNHDLTDFKLEGAHARASINCDACHEINKKYKEAPGECIDCHKQDDRHQGRLGNDCVECHSSESWAKTFFDHDQTEFYLEGKHKQAACNSCHPNDVFENTPKDCVSCHLINDIHDSPIKTECDQCHNPSDWKEYAFDHDNKTEFNLDGHHLDIKCDACHLENIFKEELGRDCIDCHLVDDIHKGKNGAKCQDCHSTTGWDQVAFDHNKDTEFPLIGAHQDVYCDACHKQEAADVKLDRDCRGCHETDDVHQGQLTDCMSCHNEHSWNKDIKFDHDLTAFPLIGIHAVTACGECHVTAAFKDADSDCSTCHQKDDFHEKALGENCAECHNPNGWRLWEFDHNRQTDYVLKGAHQELACQQCHMKPMKEKVTAPRNCNGCHSKDDIHNGRFGNKCDRCHGVDSFKKIFINM